MLMIENMSLQKEEMKKCVREGQMQKPTHCLKMKQI